VRKVRNLPNVPIFVIFVAMASDDEDVKVLPFHDMGIDDRILKAIAKLGWCEPTMIQERAVPMILDGKDVLARGRTGSGKTGAFAIPAIQKVLSSKQADDAQKVRTLVLAPSRELARQIHKDIGALSNSCGRAVRCVDLSPQVELSAQRPLLADLPDIVVGTPSRVLAHINAGNLNIKESLELLVIDEADLVFSFGHEDDVKGILAALPNIYQAVLTSATLSEDVARLKKLVLHNPVTLKLEEPQLPEASQLTQYQIKIEEEEKFVLIYALFKLKLVRGKSIVFVNGVDRCYKVKLYLEQFQIPVCVLNSELPAATRCHVVGQFNQGIYDVIVASDEKFLDEDFGGGAKAGKKKRDVDKEKSKRKKDKESGVARGIDFQFVSNVINFDFPHDVDSYIHRVGRTARGNNTGTALSLVSGKEMERAAEVEAYLKEQLTTDGESVFQPYKFRMDELDGFRYRARDAWRAVTKIAVREARLKEIKHEILNSGRLRGHFEENPRDAQALRHDRALHTVKHQAHLKNVPEYIIPKTLKRMAQGGSSGAGRRKKFKSGHGGPSGASQAKKKFERNKADPLKSLKK
jgi:ATP-dependent RNA helicase DDX56/DBP9